MEFEDRPYRLKSYSWPWGKPEDKPWRPSPVIDKRDMRDPYSVYVEWKKRKLLETEVLGLG